MLAFEWETLRDWHVPLGWRGEQIILTNMHEIHPPSDNLFSRGKLWASQTGHEYSSFFYCHLTTRFPFDWQISRKIQAKKTDRIRFSNREIYWRTFTRAAFFHLSRLQQEQLQPFGPSIPFQHPSEGVESNLWISVLILLCFPLMPPRGCPGLAVSSGLIRTSRVPADILESSESVKYQPH